MEEYKILATLASNHSVALKWILEDYKNFLENVLQKPNLQEGESNIYQIAYFHYYTGQKLVKTNIKNFGIKFQIIESALKQIIKLMASTKAQTGKSSEKTVCNLFSLFNDLQKYQEMFKKCEQ
ncbi:hypothetical protein EDEG_01196 [Edhazardia aedis USNM 41457]|uniref:Uncharacterized protein n=1 Tax=Edhazardia aedis (strain USNM 41457) TaxID=1003232 RepID=J9DTL1_EDHAE|nr:hypothetical protein EDEG_01196 [Edhazardia aedis USNM 41457]|eukprot:EJW04612.1 hypothetical protein EDEG_01196 [Edhazardia aedis USNM 41457]